MKMRVDITIWLSSDLIDQWTITDRQIALAPIIYTIPMQLLDIMLHF